VDKRNSVNTHGLNIVELLDDLRARGEQIELIDGQLHYRAPRGSAQPQTLEALRTHKKELLAWLTEQAEHPGRYPLSAGQQGLWMAWRLDPEATIYNLYLVARLRDDVDLDALHQALQWLLDRHPVLRTSYPVAQDDAAPLQYVEDGLRLALPVQDAPNWSVEQIERWVAEQADRPFDLVNGPVMRTTVLRTGTTGGGTQRLLHWSLHHIASDFLTQEVLIEDLEALYRAAQAGASAPPTTREDASALTYRDFVRWEQDSLAAQDSQLRTFWGELISHWPQSPSLPADLAASNDGYRPVTLDFAFAPDLVARLRAFVGEHRVSLFTLLLSAYQVAVGRFTDQERFVVTTPTAVRHLAGWQRTAGYFINPLCLVADLGGNPSFAELLERTQHQLGRCFEHQLFPFSEVLRLLKESGAASAAPTVGFILDAARRPARAPSLFAETLAIGQRGTPEALSLSVFDMAGELSGQFTYDANRLLPESIERLISAMTTLLGDMLNDPARPLCRLSALRPDQRAEILERWAAPAEAIIAPAADERIIGLAQRFARQAAATPGRIALIQHPEDRADASISYRDLDARADCIARRLLAEGMGPDDLVGVFLERSIDMVAALLGILKTGAAYLPLDPSYPPQRLAYMLADSGAALLLGEEALLTRLADAQTRVLRIEDIDMEPNAAAQQLPAPQPDDLAYVIYTSGSTGQPKAVEATHGATDNRLTWMWRTQPFGAHERCCQKTALSFVDSVWEIFGPLLAGVSSVILPDLLVKDVPRLIDALARYEVTRIVLVPSLLRALLDARLDAESDLRQRLPMLRHWVCSGETLPMALVQRFYAALPQARLINLYGSSEVAADVTCYDTAALAAADGHPRRPGPAQVPIGRPIDNLRCYILDPHLEPVSPGVVGELYIGGACLARGYRGRPELTRERFIINPFGPGRLFRTGDRARWLPLSKPRDADGDHRSDDKGDQRPDIEYLGRGDSQVKLRGFRIELGEIEAALRGHPAVEDAVVLLQDHPTGPRLAAYVATAAPLSPAPTPTALHQHLGQTLPDYMVPSAFTLLDRLPLTPNGKVDRQSLIGLTPSEPTGEPTAQPPETALERTLVAIWANVLERDGIGRHDDFFQLGGHSLLATRVITGIQAELGVVLPIRVLFDHPSIARLAARVEAQDQSQRQGLGDDDEVDLLL